MSAHNDYLDPDRAGLNDEVQDNDHIKEAFGDYEGPGQLYRTTYKYTDCGPGLGVTFLEWVEDVSEEPTYEMVGDDWVQTGTHMVGGSKQKFTTLYCSDLYKLGTWEDMDKGGQLITGFRVSSIIEGVDYDTDTIEVPTLYSELEDMVKDDESVSDTLSRLYWAAVEEVNDQANSIWNDTHGCPTCAKYWLEDRGAWCEDDEPWLGYDDPRWESGDTPVWKECPDCEGSGTIV